MNCDYVISITLKNDANNTTDELAASDAALVKKYTTADKIKANVKFIQVTVSNTGWQQAAKEKLALNNDFKELLGKADKVKCGLYWCFHLGPEVSSTKLAEFTAHEFYENCKLLFRKINMSSCGSAGEPKGAVSVGDQFPADVKDSDAGNFCKKLKELVPKEALEGLMVAGYRAYIELYNSEHEFYGDKSDRKVAPEYEQLLKGSVPHNTWRYQDKILRPLHPQSIDDILDGNRKLKTELRDALTTAPPLHPQAPQNAKQKPNYVAALIDYRKTETEAGKKGMDEKLLNRIPTDYAEAKKRLETKQTALFKKYREVELYLLRKIVFKFENGNWKTGSLAEYSDSANIREMITVIEDIGVKASAVVNVAI